MILHCTDHGAGPPVLLLHGLYGTGQNLGMIARGLADYRVIALDLRNHGSSPHAPDMRYASLAQDVIDTMDALGLDEAMLVGHSMGGKTAMTVALSHGARVRALAVLDIAPIAFDHIETSAAIIDALAGIRLTPDLTRQRADADLAARIADPVLRGFLLNNLRFSSGNAPYWRLDLAAIRAALPDLTGWVDPPNAQPYSGPTLVVRGGESDYVPRAAQAEIMARFPRATLQTIDHAGHWLHAEQPRAVNAALRRLFALVPNRAGA